MSEDSSQLKGRQGWVQIELTFQKLNLVFLRAAWNKGRPILAAN